MKTRLARLLMILLLLLMSSVSCLAAEMAGSSGQLLCAITEVVECDASGECTRLAAEDVGLPDFLKIDLEAKRIYEATSVSLRETRFKIVSTIDGLTILSGIEGLRGWSAVLSENNTRLNASITHEQAGFVVFGACRVEP